MSQSLFEKLEENIDPDVVIGWKITIINKINKDLSKIPRFLFFIIVIRIEYIKIKKHK